MGPRCLAVLALALAATTHVDARVDVPAQLYRLHQQKVAVPALPQSVVSSPPPAVAKRLNGKEFASLSTALQRALLWDSGLVLGGDNGDALVPVKVKCGKTMNDIFLPPEQVQSTKCPLVVCNAQTLHYANSNCSVSALSDLSLCGVGTSDGARAGSFQRAPGWSEDGELDGDSDIHVFKWRGSATSNDSFIFALSEKPKLQFSDDVSGCPNKPAFIVPCRRLSDADAQSSSTWCDPESGVLVDMWLSEETADSSDKKDHDKLVKTATIFIVLFGLIFLLCVALAYAVCHLRRERTALTTHRNSYLVPIHGMGTNCGSNQVAGAVTMVSTGSRLSTAPSPAHQQHSSAGEVEQINAGFCKQSMELAAFCEDQELLMKRVAYSSLHFTELLAKGANGEVWKGELGSQQVAIKRLFQERNEDLRCMEIFAREIRLASTLEHTNIVKFLGMSWRTLPELCMLSEFMPIGDLAHFLVSKASRRLTWANEKIGLATDIANALVYLHSLVPVIIHRDLKSLNVLLTDRLEAKLSDFGLSRERSFDETMTSGIGTLLWTAPEILRGDRYSEKADIYSYGVVLSDIDTCLPPYSLNEEVRQVKSRSMHLLPLIRQGKVAPKFSESCPPALEELARSCMDMNPDNRPNAMQIVYMLRSKVFPTLTAGK